jgi:hypothetical protein
VGRQVPASIRASTASLTSQNDLDLRQVFTQIGTYRGMVVAVKRINRKSVDLTRAIRKEFKLVDISVMHTQLSKETYNPNV